MTVNCLWEIQKAVFSALDGDATLSGLVSGVYDHVPQDAAFPYIKFADVTASDWSTKTSEGIQAVLTLEVFSRGRGAKECLAILTEIKRVLDQAALWMTGCTMVNMQFTQNNVAQAADGLTWVGNCRLSVFVQKN